MELKTDSRMLNNNLGFDDQTYSTVLANNSSQKPQYNHSLVTNKTRDSVVLLDLEARKKISEKNDSAKEGTNLDLKRGLSDISSVSSKKIEQNPAQLTRQQSQAKSNSKKNLYSKQSLENSGDRWVIDEKSGDKISGSQGHIPGKEAGDLPVNPKATDGSEQRENSEGFGYRLGESVGDNEREIFKDQLKSNDEEF